MTTWVIPEFHIKTVIERMVCLYNDSSAKMKVGNVILLLNIRSCIILWFLETISSSTSLKSAACHACNPLMTGRPTPPAIGAVHGVYFLGK